MVTHHHPNGLTLRLPDELSIVQGDDGFTIRPAGFESRRVYDETRVRLVARGGLPPGDWPERRTVGDSTYAYRIERVGEGSGGEEWRLAAYADVGGRFILCVHHTQVEVSPPDFEPAWRILGGASLGGPARPIPSR